MPDFRAGIAVGAVALLVAAGVTLRHYLKQRPSPEELERLRRATIYRNGKMGDGQILDMEPDSALIVYSYSVAGVIYTASQDVASLQAMLPADLMTMIGPVSIRFDPRNPANSIVLCEDWSGLRKSARAIRPLVS